MKKGLSAFGLMLIICVMLSAAGFAGEQNDSLTDWNLRIVVPEGAKAVLEDSEYYLYAKEAGSIPYVMVRTYGYEFPRAFLDEFTDYMKTQYADLKVTAGPAEKTFGDKKCLEIDYSYQVSGYTVKDRRIVTAAQDQTYMFASKEIEELDLTVGSMLEDVVADCEFVSDSGASQGSGLAEGYLYIREDGRPGCWLDMMGIGEETLTLYLWAGSGETEAQEHSLILDLSTAQVSENGLIIHQVRDPEGNDLSDRFKSLMIQFYLDGAVLIAEQEGETEGEASGEFIPSGSYVMRPVRVSADGEGNGKHFRPAADGPYRPEEIAAWARFYYFRNTGIFPKRAEAAPNPDDTYTIQLYETESPDGGQNEAPLARYTVDAYGEGRDEPAGESVSLMR